MSKQIKELSIWELPDTVQIPDGYDYTQIPEATSKNMMVFMEKINKLVIEVNYLRKQLTHNQPEE